MVARRKFIKTGSVRLSAAPEQIVKQIALLYYFILLHLSILDFELSFFQCGSFLCVRVYFFCYGSYSRVIVEHQETSSNNFNLKNRCNFLMYFMGNGFQTVYYFFKELHLRSYRVPRTSFSSFSLQFQILIDLLYHLSIQVSLELEKALSERQL